jgi:sugar lactone lactonase YvrE
VRGPSQLAGGAAVRLDPGVGAYLAPDAPGGEFDPGAGVFFDPGVGAYLDPGVGAYLDPGVGAYYRRPAQLRSQAVDQVFLRGALIYLTRPDESFYRSGGHVVGTTTDAQGLYSFSRLVLPGGLPVVVNALFAGNRRLTGFAQVNSGANRIDLDLGTTYAFELLRSEARRDAKSLGTYDLSRLPPLAARANGLVASGSLGADLDRLIVGRQRLLLADYAAALAADPVGLSDWCKLLGRPLTPLVTVAGTFGYGLNSPDPAPALAAPVYGAVAVAAAGPSVVAAHRFSHQISEIGADGLMRPVTAVSATDPTVDAPPPVPQNGDNAKSVRIPSPVSVATDPPGNIFVTMTSGVNAPRNVVLMICREGSPKFGLAAPQVGRIYRIAGDLAARSDLTGFDSPGGLVTDDAGNLFVADRLNDRIIRIGRSDGRLAAVAGGSGARQVTDQEVAGPAASLFMPSAVAWRRTPEGEELYVADAFHQRVRVVRNTGGSWETARVATVAGSGEAVQTAGAPVVPGGFGGDGGFATSARLHLAQVDRLDWRGSELPVGGLALDPARQTLYIADVRNSRIRQLDLRTGVIGTLTGGGANARDGIARDCRLAMPSGVAVDPAGAVLIADQGAHAVRKAVISAP